MVQRLLTFMVLVLSHGAFSQKSTTEKFFSAIRENKKQELTKMLDANPGFIDSALYIPRMFGGTTKYPLHEALMNSSKEIIDELLNRGADPGKMLIEKGFLTSTSISCLELLISYRQLDLVKNYALSFRPGVDSYLNALKRASEEKKKEVIVYLLSIGEKILITE